MTKEFLREYDTTGYKTRDYRTSLFWDVTQRVLVITGPCTSLWVSLSVRSPSVRFKLGCLHLVVRLRILKLFLQRQVFHNSVSIRIPPHRGSFSLWPVSSRVSPHHRSTLTRHRSLPPSASWDSHLKGVSLYSQFCQPQGNPRWHWHRHSHDFELISDWPNKSETATHFQRADTRIIVNLNLAPKLHCEQLPLKITPHTHSLIDENSPLFWRHDILTECVQTETQIAT